MSLECDINTQRGVAILTGDVQYPNTNVNVQRTVTPTVESSWVTIRGGVRTGVNPGGLTPFEDSEMPLGQPVFYRMLMTLPANAQRFVQRQLLSNPMFDQDTQTAPEDWKTVAPHVLTYVDGSADPEASAPLNGTSMARVSTDAQPALLYTIPLSHTGGAPGWVAGKRYRLTGYVQVISPAGQLWQNVYDQASQTWDQLGDTGVPWSDLLVNPAGGEPLTEIGALYASINAVSGDGAVVLAPIKIIGIRPGDRGKWVFFAAEFTAPATSSTNVLTLSHGGSSAESVSVWYFDKLQILQAGDATGAGNTFHPAINNYIDRNTTAADVVYTAPDTSEFSHDDSIVIEPNGAVTYYGPSVTVSYADCELLGPDYSDALLACSPIFLQDPIAPALGMWVGLIRIGDITYAARQDLYPIVNRFDQVAVSDKRIDASTDMVFFTHTLEERERVLGLFAPGHILFLRNTDSRYPENNWYIACGNLVENRVFKDHRRPERSWAVPIDKVEAPEGLIALTTIPDWQDVKDAAGGWRELAQSGTWLDVTIPGGSSGTFSRPGRSAVPRITKPERLPTVQAATGWALAGVPPQGPQGETP